MPDRPRALLVTTAGINCDRELARAFELAGAAPAAVHLTELIERPSRLDEADLVGLPGGFGYGDAVAAGRIEAQLVRRGLYDALVRAIERGTPVIAPCNGFQVLAQVGLLPGPPPGDPWPDAPPAPTVALAPNVSGRFVDAWCRVEIPADTRCAWTQGLEADDEVRLLPVAHGEGRFVTESPALLETLAARGQIAVRYAAADDPNGSADHVAGICDASGLVLGLMPHPERYTRWTHHPWWTRLERRDGEPLGLRLFRNAVSRVEALATT